MSDGVVEQGCVGRGEDRLGKGLAGKGATRTKRATKEQRIKTGFSKPVCLGICVLLKLH